MPRALASPSMVVHLWVKQGKTDHMAVLTDPTVLARLKEKQNESLKQASSSQAPLSSSFSLSSLLILDLVAHGTLPVGVRWSSTNQKDTVEASSIRFRDLEAEGRGSARSGRSSRSRGAGRTASLQPPVTKKQQHQQSKKRKMSSSSEGTTTTIAAPTSSGKKRKAVVLKRKRIREEEENLQPTVTTAAATGKIGPREGTSTNSSVVTSEGRDDVSENSVPSLPIETPKQTASASAAAAAAVAPFEKVRITEKFNNSLKPNASESYFSTNSNSNKIISRQEQKMPMALPQEELQKKNLIDLDGDDDFDSSDDEAIVYRMKLKKERAAGLRIKQESLQKNAVAKANSNARIKPSQQHHTQTDKNKKRSRPYDDNMNAAAWGDNHKHIVAKRKKSGAARVNGNGSTGRRSGSGSDDDSDYSDPGSSSASESFSAPTEVSSRTSGRNRQRSRYPNGFDSNHDDDDDDHDNDNNNHDGNAMLAQDGKTNTTNWMKMKRFFNKNFL